MKDRIGQLMNAQHMNQQTFAEVLNISFTSLSGIFNDRAKPILNHIDVIKKKSPTINLDWLLCGNGPMFMDEYIGDIDNHTISASSAESVLNLDDSPSTLPESNVIQPQLSSVKRRNQLQPVANNNMKHIDNNLHKIAEIRVFYDGQAWETFASKE